MLRRLADAVARKVVRTHRKLRFAGDSPLEQSGFELPVPRAVETSGGGGARGRASLARPGQGAACGTACGENHRWDRFVADSPLEGDGFELPVPRCAPRTARPW